jgi:hypothetical protein
MLFDEYETLEDVQNIIAMYKKNLLEDDDETTNKSSSELSSTRENLFKIDKNIDIISQKQRTLLAECIKLESVYSETIKLALTTQSVHRFNLQEVILSQLEHYDSTNAHSIDEVCAKLLSPLMFPKLPDILDIGLFYAPQLKREDFNEADILPDGEYIESDSLAKRIDQRNLSHVTVINLLLQYAQSSGESFLLSELWEYYTNHSDVATLTNEKLIFLVFLQLYEYGTIDIEQWKNDPNKSRECQGEFDLSYALGEVYTKHPDMFGVKAIHISKGNSMVQLSWLDTSFGIPCEQKVEMDNLKFTTEMI